MVELLYEVEYKEIYGGRLARIYRQRKACQEVSWSMVIPSHNARLRFIALVSIHDEILYFALGCLDPSRTLTDDQITDNCTNLRVLPNSSSRHAIAPLISRDDTGLRRSSCLRAYTAGHFHGLWPRLCNNPQHGLAVTTMWAGWSSNAICLCRTHNFGGLEGKTKSRMVIKNQTLSWHREIVNASPKV
jgi:hypothetical protein